MQRYGHIKLCITYDPQYYLSMNGMCWYIYIYVYIYIYQSTFEYNSYAYNISTWLKLPNMCACEVSV